MCLYNLASKNVSVCILFFFFFSSRRRHTRCALVTGVQTCALPIYPAWAAALSSPLQRMMYCDTVTYLPDDILVKVDRASMAVGLEVRSPLLDHRVIEFAWRLPHAMLRKDGDGKWPLRQLFDRHLPPAFRDRPKQGFAIPVADWLRSEEHTSE